jgi:hypothetical protein
MPGWREDASGQAILEIQRPGQLRLLYKGKTQNGTGALATEVLVLWELVRGQCVVKDDALPGPDNIADNGFREFGGRGGCLAERDRNGILAGDSFRHDAHLIAIWKEQNASPRAGVLDRHHQEFFDQSIADNLGWDRLRHL